MSGLQSVALAMDASTSVRRSYSSPNLLSLPLLDTVTGGSLSLKESMSQFHLLLDDDDADNDNDDDDDEDEDEDDINNINADDDDDDDNAIDNVDDPTSLGIQSLPNSADFEIPSFNSDFDLGTLFLGGHRPSPSSPVASVAPQRNSPTQRRNTEPLPFARAGLLQANLHESWRSAPKSIDVFPEGGQKRSTRSSDGRSGPNGPPKFSDQLRPPLGRRQKSIEHLASSAKRAWKSSSRSSSPKSRPGSPADKFYKYDPLANSGGSRQPITPKGIETSASPNHADASQDTSKASSKSFTRYFSKIKGKSIGSPTKTSESVASNLSRASSAISLGQPASSSIDTNGSHSTSSDTSLSTPSTVDDSPTEMQPRMLDPLWSSFKTLEMEFRGFAAKAMPAKISQVQTLVLPFLKSATNQAPIGNLRPEDVDRRATIFNKWWGAILDVLEGQSKPTVPGVDRPILLEAVTMIMMRPEWRQTTTYFLPLAERSPKERVQSRPRTWTNASDTSESSSQYAMLAESAEHNVRTMFVSNLIKQVSFVVDRMSLRHAPLSMVNFAGKTCAYAFFFAPGVADILLRLWALTPDLIRRAGDALKLPRKDSGESDDIVALFPPKLSSFGWSSPRRMWETLKHVPKLPMLVARIPWTGPWVSRWKGRDTDLLFIFCKYFHILADEFMPPGLPLTEKARAPAFVLVHAQLLSTVDATIHRQMAAETIGGSSLADPDASLAMALPPSNLHKGMAENRLVVLLKDILSSDCPRIRGARHTFAEAFAVMLKAAACRTPRYNSNACFTLCDFLEEILILYSDLESPEHSGSYIDWDFWVGICKLVLTSLNTMSEVRMLSFLYTIWDAVAKSPEKKLSLCRDWLLSEDTFNQFFNNWCPMVRAYYQRLLCWRVCRDKGVRDEVDTEIFLLATKRLTTAWSHYLYLKQDSEKSGRAAPSAAPMSPTLGKRFIIIRQEVNTPQPGLLMGFDAPTKSFNAELVPSDGMGDGLGAARKDDKKRWSLFGRVLSLTTGGGGGGGQSLAIDGLAANGSADYELRIARREVAESRLRTGPSASAKTKRSLDSGRSSPVFDEQKYVFKFVLGWQQPPIPPRERALAQPRLPTPAQARISIRSPGASPLLPPVRRAIGTSGGGGLVQEARNATFLDVPPLDFRLNLSSLSLGRNSEEMSAGPGDHSGTATPKSDRLASISSVNSSVIQFEAGELVEAVTRPVQPAGKYVKTGVYCGRALAEWSLVVAECNNFVERRRDEGIAALGDVEVPLLNVDGFRRAAG